MPVSRRTRSAGAEATSANAPVRLADDGKTVVVEGESSEEDGSEEEDEDEDDDDDEGQQGSEEDDQEQDASVGEEEAEGNSMHEDESDEDEQDSDELQDEGQGNSHTQLPVKPQSQSSIDSKSASKRATSQVPASAIPSASSSSSSSSTHLDPSLFQTYFQSQSQSRLTPPSILKPSSSASSTSALKHNRPRKTKTKTRKGIVTGRDGLPMKRLKDGRTILRALSRSGSGPSHAQAPPREDLVDKVAQSKAEKYRSRKLGLDLSGRSSKSEMGTSVGAGTSKPATTDDDPLGLNDPAFLPGGEFAHLANLTGDKKRKRRAKSSGGGKANIKNDKRTQRVPTSNLPKKSAQSGMPAFAFRRSAA